MLKRLLFLSFVAMTTQLSAQITITSADAPRASYYTVEAEMDSTDAANLAIGTAGTNRTWNFAAVRRAAGSTDNTTYLRAVNAQMPLIARFPTATHAIVTGTSADYFQVTTTMFAVLGSADGTVGEYSRNSKPQRNMVYPATYNTTFNDTFKLYQYDASTMTIDSSISARSSNTVDAWGSVTTPLGTFNAVRVTQLQNVTVSGFAVVGTVQSWWVNGYATPILQRQSISAPALGINETGGTYLVRRTVATEEWGATVANAYPNPTMKGVTLDFSVEKAQQIAFQVTNLLGQTVVSEQPNFFSQGNHSQYISLDGLANGLYMLNVLNGKNEIISAKKIMIQK